MDTTTHMEVIERIREDNKTTTFERVSCALQEMMAADEHISFYSVAAKAQVSRSTLYRRPDLKELVVRARDEASIAAIGEGSIAERAHTNLSLQVAHLQRELNKALAENQALKRELFGGAKKSIQYAVVPLEKVA